MDGWQCKDTFSGYLLVSGHKTFPGDGLGSLNYTQNNGHNIPHQVMAAVKTDSLDGITCFPLCLLYVERLRLNKEKRLRPKKHPQKSQFKTSIL